MHPSAWKTTQHSTIAQSWVTRLQIPVRQHTDRCLKKDTLSSLQRCSHQVISFSNSLKCRFTFVPSWRSPLLHAVQTTLSHYSFPRHTLLEDLTFIPFIACKGPHRPSSSSREYGHSVFWEQALKPVKSGFLEDGSKGVEWDGGGSGGQRKCTLRETQESRRIVVLNTHQVLATLRVREDLKTFFSWNLRASHPCYKILGLYFMNEKYRQRQNGRMEYSWNKSKGIDFTFTSLIIKFKQKVYVFIT